MRITLLRNTGTVFVIEHSFRQNKRYVKKGAQQTFHSVTKHTSLLAENNTKLHLYKEERSLRKARQQEQICQVEFYGVKWSHGRNYLLNIDDVRLIDFSNGHVMFGSNREPAHVGVNLNSFDKARHGLSRVRFPVAVGCIDVTGCGIVTILHLQLQIWALAECIPSGCNITRSPHARAKLIEITKNGNRRSQINRQTTGRLTWPILCHFKAVSCTRI